MEHFLEGSAPLRLYWYLNPKEKTYNCDASHLGLMHQSEISAIKEINHWDLIVA